MKRIRSIGWLNGLNGTINLTPCVDNSAFPTVVSITRSEFEFVKGNTEKMMALAAQKLGIDLRKRSNAAS